MMMIENFTHSEETETIAIDSLEMIIGMTFLKDAIYAATPNGMNVQDFTEVLRNSRGLSNYSPESFSTRLKIMASRLEDGSLEKKAIVKALLCLEI